MLRAPLFALFLLGAAAAAGQGIHGNEWIDHGRRYWRFAVGADGLVRIDSAALANSGFPVATVDPRELMLFSRERQVPIYVQGEGDGVFHGTDFIEFHARKNDAWLDALMYEDPAHLANPYYSMHNDTIRYYLTWDASAPKLRIKAYANTAFAAHVPRTWSWAETLDSRHGGYQVGLREVQSTAQVTSGFMVEGEGFYNAAVLQTTGNTVEQSFSISTPRAYAGADAPPAKVFWTAAGASKDAPFVSRPNHHLLVAHGPAPGTVGADTIYSDFSVVRGGFPVPASSIGTSTAVRYRVVHDLTTPGLSPNYLDRQVVSHTRIRYARQTHLNNQLQLAFDVPADPADPLAYLDFLGVQGAPVVYAHGDTIRRILPPLVSGRRPVLFPQHPSAPETRVHVFTPQTVTAISALTPVNGTGWFTDFRSLERDSAMLIITHGSLMGAALDYASYREGHPSNRYNTVTVDVDEIYDQFGGGIPKHSFAIRRYCRYVLETWNSAPRALFLIGKSVQTATVGQLTGYRTNAQGSYERCLVPSYGYPPSDPCFTLGLRNDPRRVEIPTGRLSANTPEQVRAYLDKVRVFEGQPPAAWMKNILHFRGGFTVNENLLFGQYFSGFKRVAQDTSFGGNVVDFVKTSSDVFQQASADSVRRYIEEGVTLMTFIAHAFADGFDITIDNPANYEWNGRHPMVIGNSCYIGNIHLNSPNSTGEQWVMMPGKGPIAFLASVDAGIVQFLGPYTNQFYRSFSQVNYGKSIGEHMRHASFMQLAEGPDILRQNNVHTFTLQGDPTLVLNSWPLPDYSISGADILHEPATVTADADSFRVKAVVTNIGKAVNARFSVALERTAPGLPTSPPLLRELSNVYLRDTAVFTVPTLGMEGGHGLNRLQVRVDLDPDEVPELDDVGNNVANKDLFISSGDLVPVYPYNHAIVPDPAPALKASTGDPFAAQRSYVFQIDTTDLFNSPVLETATLNAPGGVVTWRPSSIYALNAARDSTVFFWRCSIDSAGNDGYSWYERSFQFIRGKHGWGQAHYFQFKDDAYNGVVYDRPARRFGFDPGQRNLQAYVRGNSSGVANDSTKWVLDLEPQDYNGCSTQPSWHVAVVDPATFEAWATYWNGENPDHRFGNQNDGSACRNRIELRFIFRTNNAAELAGMRNMVMNAVPDGHHLLIYTWRYLDKTGTRQNAPGLLADLEQLGAPAFANVPDSVPYIFYVRKGQPGTARVEHGTFINEYIGMSVWIDGLADRGMITTMEAGPARAWHALYWNEEPTGPRDSTRIVLRGVTVDGAEEELLNVPSGIDSIPDLGSLVDARTYPTLRIRGLFHDIGSAQPDPAQMERWQLLSSPVPECAIDPPLGYLNALNDLAEGQEASVLVAVHNISEFGMDSLMMAAWVIGRDNTRRTVHHKLNGPLPAGGVLLDTVRFSTRGLGGANTLIIEANPIDSATGRYHQLEQYHFNNIAQLRFLVDQDKENPILDVTFDGMHILDGDIVSARPEIVVTLNDENPVLLLDSPQDTAHFRVYLAGPGRPLDRIYFRDGTGVENMQFLPASGPDNVSRIVYRPAFEADGRYILTVQASDKSDNRSGDNDYKVSFEVLNKPTITEVLNYPNPFTTSTRFVFTLTGREPPTHMRIQIMTVTGRVVREVRMHEIGPVRIGRNISEFAWDGTDEFGDRLGRGVYMYRVIAQLNGQDIEYRATGASEYFHKGFGKMYLLR